MSHRRTLTLLACIVAVIAAAAAGAGILSDAGPGPYEYRSIRGDDVTIHGRGVYRDMSAELAPQGIAQDYVTLLLGIPLLLGSLVSARRGSVRGRIVFAGTLGYFLVTYLFYLMMGMYNVLFLAWTGLLSASFFGFSLALLGFDAEELKSMFDATAPVRSAGWFLLFNAGAIALLWLGVVLPPLLSGTVVPPEVEHYTTLVVQGLDLAVLLPLAAVSGALLLRRWPLGYLFAPVYLVFLTLLMTALTAKIVAMGLLGHAIVPAVFIVPTLNVLAGALAVKMVLALPPTPTT